jgi:RNA polymerase sigma-70 factor, ECF subfamily
MSHADESLMRRVRLGEQEHMSILIRRFANQLLTFIRRLGVRPQAADEVFQEVFLAVWVHRRRYQPERNFKPWLLGIATNKCRHALRGQRVLEPIDNHPQWTQVGTTPVDHLIQTQTAQIVEIGISRLPLKQREVVVMRLWNDMSYAEIAWALNSSESSVRSNMSFGLSALREYLEPKLRE